MKILLLLCAIATLALLPGCINVEKDTPDHVSVERTTVIER